MTLDVGTTAPDFTLENQFGEEISLSGLLAERPVVLVFFPLAFSGICTGELCELQDNIAAFDDSSVTLVGVSVDSKYTLRAWAEQEGYQFSILSDFWPHGKVSSDYGVFLDDAGIATRGTYVIAQDGTVAAAFATAPGEARDFGAYREAITALTA
ncbi:peroxiredoxin [Leucobacter sp. M11]|uniref:peroxiredoxin n=1 Tax=Leucobacter sp. M11 TaxID=2993565 RepID=UPI002D7FE1D2|nr:peroxiredoxin [Leucobacter sp. M11]MEB4616109.1 peroxiredoxin [Leucobacter sp. M11]